ncbi:MAG: recombinase family protein [candidate division NC10 bacterium]|nr:recombinase family protein [candidate division NC10 bacterium]
MRAALYIRVSTDQQVEHGDSLQVQQERLEAYARSKGWAIHQLYADRGVSARDTNRPAFQQLLSDLKTKNIDVILVTKLDRVFRNTRDFLETTDFFETKGTRFVCLDGDIDTTTPSGRVFSTIRAALAQFERETTAERVREVMLARATKGLWNGGVVPYGFQHVPDTKTLAPEPGEADMVRRIYSLFQETHSIRAVVHQFNDAGLRTRAGERWSATSIRRILGNRLYIGASTYNRRRTHHMTSAPRPQAEHIIIDGIYPALINTAVFRHVKTLLASHARDRRKEGRLYRYYRCWGHTAKGKSQCPGNTIDLSYLESLVTNELQHVAVDHSQLKSQLDEVARDTKRDVQTLLTQHARLSDTLGRAEMKSQRLLELYEDGLIDKIQFASRRQTLEQDLHRRQTQLEHLNQRLQVAPLSTLDLDASLASLKTLASVYQELPDEEKRRTLLRTVLSRIVVADHNIQMGIFVNSERTGKGSWRRRA